MNILKSFILGMLSFLVSQILIRLPVLKLIQQSSNYNVYISFYPLLVIGLLAITAGIFEETGRFLFRKCFLSKQSLISYAIIFGLGHSLMEIIYLFYPYLGTGLISPIAYLERLFATFIHIGLSVIVWEGFLLNKKYKYLLIAIIVHGIVDFIPFISSILIAETILGIEAILLILYTIRTYKKFGGMKNEN
ncbi:YhfC family glutamic-type intramembrane protease [Microaceticoccus formicicus]|uniref:YhfC family glutamic-type intramembrane protease n=1 Tax=Microaceticoccus formicicus TaxID=3118105 RepID=UPI003CD037BD|nr:YhfC family glutamic-type intramembrane protease [Peptoniphilaceae bacterium AMB_02]